MYRYCCRHFGRLRYDFSDIPKWLVRTCLIAWSTGELVISVSRQSRRPCEVLIGRSPVRISFAGGGTDLPAYYERFGGAVLSTAINKYFYTILGKRSDGRIQV